MNNLASPGQIRGGLFRWMLITVPAILLLGFLSGQLANSGYGNPWFDALRKPAIMPPGWVFGVVWSALYVLMGIALAMILNARGAAGRTRALTLFGIQFAMNLAWSPLFFAAHQVLPAFILIVVLLVVATLTTLAFGRIRSAAAWLMLPYLLWLGFASVLNWRVHELNPGAALAPARYQTQIPL